MKINKKVLNEMKVNCLIVWERLIEINPELLDRLNNSTMNYLWFKTWSSISYGDNNPNVIRDKNGQRLLNYNPEYELYPCDANDDNMKAAYKRIVRFIKENEVKNET